MRSLIMIFVGLGLLYAPILSFAENRIATKDEVIMLKQDVLNGKVKIGITRLKDIKTAYGDAASITDSSNKITYDYGDLRIDFDKRKIWTGWSYDGFKKPAYTDSIDNLRFDLESNKLVGENITYDMIRKDYGEPTESNEMTQDGEISTYFYGDIKLTFENTIVIRSWRGSGLDKLDEQALGSK